MPSWGQVEGGLCLPFAEVTMLLVARNLLTSRWKVCINDNMVMAVSLTHLSCWLNGHSFGPHFDGDRTGNLSAVLRSDEENLPPLRYVDLDGIGDGRVIRDVVAPGEQQPEGMLARLEVQDSFRLTFTKMAVSPVRRDGFVQGRQLGVNDNVMVAITPRTWPAGSTVTPSAPIRTRKGLITLA